MTIAACDDTTDNIGSSITNDVDNISIKDQVFNVTTLHRFRPGSEPKQYGYDRYGEGS